MQKPRLENAEQEIQEEDEVDSSFFTCEICIESLLGKPEKLNG